MIECSASMFTNGGCLIVVGDDTQEPRWQPRRQLRLEKTLALEDTLHSGEKKGKEKSKNPQYRMLENISFLKFHDIHNSCWSSSGLYSGDSLGFVFLKVFFDFSVYCFSSC